MTEKKYRVGGGGGNTFRLEEIGNGCFELWPFFLVGIVIALLADEDNPMLAITALLLGAALGCALIYFLEINVFG